MPATPSRRVLALTLCAGSLTAGAGEVAPPQPVADYDLVGWLGDALGNGATLSRVGEGPLAYTSVVEGERRRLALSVPAGAGLRLALGPLLPLDNWSLAMIVQVESTASYAKLLDTNNLASDRGVYAQDNDLRYYTAGSADTGTFPDGALRQVVVSRDAAGNYSGYLDGRLQFSFVDTVDGSQLGAISSERVLHILRDDNTTSNSEESNAVLFRLRLFDRSLSAAEVTALETNRQPSSIFRLGGFEIAP